MPDLKPYLHMRVCDAIKAPGPASLALIEAAEDGKKSHNYYDVLIMLTELEACQLTIADWIAAREDWI